MPFKKIDVPEYIEKLRNEDPEFRRLWDNKEIHKDFIKLGYTEEEAEELVKASFIRSKEATTIRPIRIIQLIRYDKKFGAQDRNDRVTEINQLLGFNRKFFTKGYQMPSGNKYIVEYKRLRFWYDNQPITLKAIWKCFNNWHVMHWLVYTNGGRCGFHSSIVRGIFSKKEVYKWLKQQSRTIDQILIKM